MNTPLKNKNSTEETLSVPTDVMLEIAQIILQAELPHEIIGVKENKSQIIIGISFQADLKFHQDALKNIQDILKAYHDLVHTEHEDIDWRD
jgi:hypothetical protein